MDYSITEKIKILLCKFFGHRFAEEGAWEHKGRVLDCCKRCNRVVEIS